MEDFCNGLLIITNSRAEKIQYNNHLFFCLKTVNTDSAAIVVSTKANWCLTL